MNFPLRHPVSASVSNFSFQNFLASLEERCDWAGRRVGGAPGECRTLLSPLASGNESVDVGRGGQLTAITYVLAHGERCGALRGPSGSVNDLLAKSTSTPCAGVIREICVRWQVASDVEGPICVRLAAVASTSADDATSKEAHRLSRPRNRLLDLRRQLLRARVERGASAGSFPKTPRFTLDRRHPTRPSRPYVVLFGLDG